LFSYTNGVIRSAVPRGRRTSGQTWRMSRRCQMNKNFTKIEDTVSLYLRDNRQRCNNPASVGLKKSGSFQTRDHVLVTQLNTNQ
jgi:hypothetical protein